MQYLGGKARIAKHIVEQINKYRKPHQVYVEPFVGGCNILPLVNGERIASDINADIIEFYKALQAGWIPPENVSEEEYRTLKNQLGPSKERGFAGMACAFAGGFFKGYARGNYNYALTGKRAALKIQNKIEGVSFYSGNYWEIDYPENSFIYCDPPYQGTTGYQAKFDHEKFYTWCRFMAKKGHTLLISEYKMPEDFLKVFEIERNLEIRRNKTNGEIRVERLFLKTEDF